MPRPRPGGAFALVGGALASLLLSACVETGDFGRPRPSIWNEALSTTGSIAAWTRGEPVSAYVFTDDEEELRRRAWRFLMPAHERAWFERQLANIVRARVLPVAAQPNGRAVYFAALMRDHGRSPASRYRRLSEDVFADAKLMEPFAFVTARVSRPTRRACARSPMSATLPRGRRARRRSGSPRTDASLPGCGGRSTDAPPPIVTRSSTSSSKRRKRTGLRSSGRFAPLRSAEFFSTAFPAAHGRPAAACRRQRKWWRLRQSFRATRWS